MAHIKGITVTLITKTSTGAKDAFNRPIETETRTNVDNVLVAPLSQGAEIVNEISMNGKKARYQLGIPKGDANKWEDCLIEFFGQQWKSIGFSTEGIEENIPLDWNRRVVVERYG